MSGIDGDSTGEVECYRQHSPEGAGQLPFGAGTRLPGNSLVVSLGSRSVTVMSETTKSSEQGAGDAQAPGKGGVAGRLAVGEYVGRVAAEAAQAVRRAGLRPGLDRSFECSPELFGRVVAQDPSAGSQLARNGLVTLYVAAPGAADHEEDDPPRASGVGETSVDESPRVLERRPVEDRPVGTAADAWSEQDTVEWEPVGVTGSGYLDDGHSAEHRDDGEDGETSDELRFSGERDADSRSGESRADEAAHEELMALFEDLLAARATAGGGGLRGGQRAAVGRGVRARLAAHPWLAGTVGAVFAVWAVVGVVAALAGRSTTVTRWGVTPTVAQRVGAGSAGADSPQTVPLAAVNAPRASATSKLGGAPERVSPGGAHHHHRLGLDRAHGQERPQVARAAPSERIVTPQAEATGHPPPVTPEETASVPLPAVASLQSAAPAAAQERVSAEEHVAIEFGPER